MCKGNKAVATMQRGNRSVSEFVIKGLMAEDIQLFEKRIILIADRFDFINELINGIPVDIEVVNPQEVKEFLTSKSYNVVELKDVSLDWDRQSRAAIRVRYTVERTRYYKSQEDINKVKNGGWVSDWQSKADDTYKYGNTTVESDNSTFDSVPGVSIIYV